MSLFQRKVLARMPFVTKFVLSRAKASKAWNIGTHEILCGQLNVITSFIPCGQLDPPVDNFRVLFYPQEVRKL